MNETILISTRAKVGRDDRCKLTAEITQYDMHALHSDRLSGTRAYRRLRQMMPVVETLSIGKPHILDSGIIAAWNMQFQIYLLALHRQEINMASEAVSNLSES
jgi:hypothetical protein